MNSYAKPNFLERMLVEMSIAKQILRHPKVMRFLCWVAARYIGFVYKTTRWEHRGFKWVEPYWQARKPLIVCFWHNRLLMTCFAWQSPTQQFHMLISSHPDGQYIAQVVGHYGIHTIPGSSSKGGSQALRRLLRVLKDGHAVGITPDGPRGPRFEVSDGIIQMARLSGADIIPVTYAISRRRVLGTWDRLVLALPFSKGILMYGKPISQEMMQSLDQESLKKHVRSTLMELSNDADTALGQSPIEGVR